MDFLTTDEVAVRLGISVAAVRKKAARGELPGKKVGGQWLIEASSVAERQDAPVRGDRVNVVDLPKALRHIEATDLTELWVPDVLRFEDYLAEPQEVLRSSEERLRSRYFDPAIEVDIAKTHFFTRGAILLSLEDRVAYQSLVAAIAPKVDSLLSDAIYSARLSTDPRWFLKSGAKSWVSWKKLIKNRIEETNGWMIKTDLTAYFDNILHRPLIEEVKMLGVDDGITGPLEEMLTHWAIVPGMGLPQGPNASRVLGNLYLAPVDQILLAEGEGKFEYYRYQDDVRIVGKSKSAVIEAMRTFERACRRRGLTASAGKTHLLQGEAAVRDCENLDRESAQYNFDAGKLLEARGELKAILRDALKTEGVIDAGNVRFSLWRLARLRERSVLRLTLDRLEDLAPVPSVVAAYLAHFVYRKHVVDSISSFLFDAARAHSTSLVTWLFAAMLERPTEMPTDWIKLGRMYALDRNNPIYLRSVAACVLARGKLPSDIYQIRQEIRTEYDPNLLRGYAAALTWARSLGPDEQDLLRKKSPIIARTVNYLAGRETLRSLVFKSRQLYIK